MIKIVFLLSFVFFHLHSFEIAQQKDHYNFNDFTILHDKQTKYNIDTILHMKDKFTKPKNPNIGIIKYPVWSYAKIINQTKNTQQLVFTHPRAGIDFMDLYILKNNQIIQKHQLGDMNPLENRIIQSRKSNFLFELAPHQEYEFIIRYKSFGAIDTNLQIYQPKYYANIVKNESSISGFILGMSFIILSILVYLMIYFPSVSTTLFFIILFGSVSIQLSVAGVFYEMGLNSYLNTIVSWSFGNIAAACIGLFPIYYFDLKKLMSKTTRVLQLLSFLIIVLSLSFLFYPYYNEILYLAPLANILFFLITIVLVYVSIHMYKKQIDGYKIYGFGNGLFLLSVVYFIFGLLGLIKTNSLFYSILLIGNSINIFCLGYLIFTNLIKIKKEKEDTLLMLNEYSKLSTIGQSMINLSHQWKEPINHIYYAINNIYAAKEFKDQNLPHILDKSLEQIKETVTLMSNTSQNFLSTYEDKNYIQEVDIKTAIESVIIVFRKPIDEININLELDLENNITINTNKYLLANILMVILENSIKAFKKRKISKPNLCIELTKRSNCIVIVVKDNAGGIKESPIDSIFEKDLSNSNSTGLGLFLVKNILTHKLNGEIQASNEDDGATFIISLKE